MVIRLFNRNTGREETEKVAGDGLMRFLHETAPGRLTLELLVKRKFYSALTGWFCDRGISRRLIPGFVKDYHIHMEEALRPVEGYQSFNDFFTRTLQPGARPFPEAAGALGIPGDGRLKAFENIDTEQVVCIKGMTYRLAELLNAPDEAARYQGGTCLLLRLAPVDYHRFHFMDDGVPTQSWDIPGDYYSVNPIALTTIANVFCRNRRAVSFLDSRNFGRVAWVEVGATSVGGIVQTYTPGQPVRRGQEKGYFRFGGSTIVFFFEKGKIRVDEDILRVTREGYEARVLAGEKVAEAGAQA